MLSTLLCSCGTDRTSSSEPPLQLLLGSYSPAEAEGIKLYDFDQNTGQASLRCGLKGVANPSYLCRVGDSTFLSVSETDDGNDALHLFQVTEEAKTVSIQLLSSQPTNGKAPCYVNYHPATSQAFTANYNGGSLTTFGINQDRNEIAYPLSVEVYEGNGPFLPNQQQAHIHCAQFSPDSTLLYICDLGSDRIHCRHLASGETMPDIEVEPGSGPRHLIFSNDGRFAYLINELSGFVTVFANQGNTLKALQYAQCDSVGGHGSADIHLSPDGRFLYASNRLKSDGVSIYSVNAETGLISKIGYQLTGIHPRNFAITPNGRYLLCACRDSNEVQIYSIDAESGLLTPTGDVIQMSQPVFVMFF